jgi:predicted solute-binding protein
VVRPLRLGVVDYLNARPLVHGLESEAGFTLARGMPARVAAMLHGGEVDLGLIPAVEYAFGDYAVVPGVAIGSRGPVRSVNLYHRGPLAAVRRVALDASSRSSAALVRVLLRERLGRDPEYLSRPPQVEAMLREADAALLIGDAALDFAGEAERLDLGEEWTRLTGLPFVYAFWAGRPGAVGPAEVRRLQQALREGLLALDDIAAGYGAMPERAEANRGYLRQNIAYALGPDEKEGLREFFRRAFLLGLVPRVPALRFHADS